MKKLSRFPNPETPMSEELLFALSRFSNLCMMDKVSEVMPEDVIRYLIERETAELANEFKPECLFPAI